MWLSVFKEVTHLVCTGKRRWVRRTIQIRHSYMVDEVGPKDRVLLIGHTRQHQGVDAGWPFEQLQHAGKQVTAIPSPLYEKPQIVPKPRRIRCTSLFLYYSSDRCDAPVLQRLPKYFMRGEHL
jgi:hypothetical protein